MFTQTLCKRKREKRTTIPNVDNDVFKRMEKVAQAMDQKKLTDQCPTSIISIADSEENESDDLDELTDDVLESMTYEQRAR